MRTLYETFLIVVTGGFATLVSKADSIAGSQPERVWMARGVIGLALIVVYLLWQVAPRYRRSSKWIKNLECALGLRAEGRPAVLMPEDPSLLPINKVNLKTWRDSWWNKDAWLHTTWALLLTGYTLFAGFFSFRVIQKAPEHTAVQNPAAQTVQRIEQVFQVPTASPGKQETGRQKKH